MLIHVADIYIHVMGQACLPQYTLEGGCGRDIGEQHNTASYTRA